MVKSGLSNLEILFAGLWSRGITNNEFKSELLREKRAVGTWNLGTILAFAS